MSFKEQNAPDTPRLRASESNVQALNMDIIRALARHELLFLLLLALQLVVECFFETMHAEYREDAILELSLIYPSVSLTVLRLLFALAGACELVFCVGFLALGVTAAIRSKPRLYHRFATVALIGTLGQLPLAYLNRFNLLIFFLRFISYAYARFHWNLLRAISMLREELIL